MMKACQIDPILDVESGLMKKNLIKASRFDKYLSLLKLHFGLSLGYNQKT